MFPKICNSSFYFKEQKKIWNYNFCKALKWAKKSKNTSSWRRLQKMFIFIFMPIFTVKIFEGPAPNLKATFQRFFWIWVSITIWHNLPSAQFFLSEKSLHPNGHWPLASTMMSYGTGTDLIYEDWYPNHGYPVVNSFQHPVHTTVSQEQNQLSVG